MLDGTAAMLSLCGLEEFDFSCASVAALWRSYLRAVSKPSRVGFSFFAGVAVLVPRDEPLRLIDLPKGPFSSWWRF